MEFTPELKIHYLKKIFECVLGSNQEVTYDSPYYYIKGISFSIGETDGGYTVVKEKIIYNYPHEPDDVDLVEIFTTNDFIKAANELVKCHVKELIECFTEGFYYNHVFQPY